ncbi:homocysteine S-methyltransferase family protein [Alitabrizicola rongguiensis]|uniref:homocysteine S-methyltransferase family protein n=1 Tax=Alitabrizicola rongguiensis TaxID=2909234 RepID=UPI001F3FBFCE|nr:homocysteine S-methyltransferase family protein [Tabrizicola rongguiensis]
MSEHLLARSNGRPWLSDGGLETTLIFLEGFELPGFASFPLLQTAEGRAALQRYFREMLETARAHETGLVLGTATWRASRGWGPVLGLTDDEIDEANRRSVAFAESLRDEFPDVPSLIEGVLGPHGDAYAPDRVLTAQEARDYHRPQVEILAQAGADFIGAYTLSSTGEAIGIAEAAREVKMPVLLSFTVETDGRLISGTTLAEAITETDAATGSYPMWYGINCAHPDHFRDHLKGDWIGRIGSIRANASRRSHAELDEATELDAGDPQDLAQDYAQLLHMLPAVRVLGGCCGTDHRHIAAIGAACLE